MSVVVRLDPESVLATADTVQALASALDTASGGVPHARRDAAVAVQTGCHLP